MLEFLSLGALQRTNAFPSNDVSEELALSVIKVGYKTLPYYLELIEPLQEQGRYDLVRVINRKFEELRKERWKKRLKQFDSNHLNGRLLRFKQYLSGRKPKRAGHP
jgi:hypothetical protein